MNALRPYAQLVRLPNVFTALADVSLAALALGALPERLPAFLALALASACLYAGGMAFNDFFDVEQDRRERPSRPIPSGRVTPRHAALLGTALLAAGVLAAALAGTLTGDGYDRHPPLLALALVAAILAYDRWLKRTWAGPLGMGLCRFLNVLLGLSLAPATPWSSYLALVVGTYIVGVTWFARTEARDSSRNALSGAALVMLASLLLALPLPVLAGESDRALPFPYLLVAFGTALALPVLAAIGQPTPPRVQAAVKRAVLGLVALDAVLATAFIGAPGLAVLALLVPIALLRRWRWLYVT